MSKANEAVVPVSSGSEWMAWAPLFSVMIWSGNVIVSRAAAVVIAPTSMTLYRWVLAFAILTPFVARAVWRKRAYIVANAWRLALLGALGMAMYQGLAYQAARLTTAVNMGVIVATMPLLSNLLAAVVVVGERLRWWRVVGLLVSLCGLIVLMTHGQPWLLLRGSVNYGDLLMLVAVLSNVVYGTLVKRWAMPLGTWEQLYAQIFFGVLVMLPLWWFAPASPVTLAAVPLLLYAGIPASLGAPFFWMTGIRHLGVARATLFMNLLPLMVAGLACLLLGESLHAYHAVGGALALAGVAMGLKK